MSSRPAYSTQQHPAPVLLTPEMTCEDSLSPLKAETRTNSGAPTLSMARSSVLGVTWERNEQTLVSDIKEQTG